MLGRRFVDVVAARAFWAEIAGARKSAIEHPVAWRLCELVRPVNRPCGEPLVQFGAVQIERGGFERAIGASLVAGCIGAAGEIIGNVGQALIGSAKSTGVDQHQIVCAQMIEQSGETLLEQRQPMLHPRQPPPVADRLIERVGGSIGAEQIAIAAAEALD